MSWIKQNHRKLSKPILESLSKDRIYLEGIFAVVLRIPRMYQKGCVALSKLTVVLTANHTILCVEAIIYKHRCLMSPHEAFRSGCVRLWISCSEPNGKQGAEMRLGFKSSQFPCLSYKSCHTKMRCESNSTTRKMLLMITRCCVLILMGFWMLPFKQSGFPLVWNTWGLASGVWKPRGTANHLQCTCQIPQSRDVWLSREEEGKWGTLQQNQMMDSRKTRRNPSPAGFVKERAVGLHWGAGNHVSSLLALGSMASFIASIFFPFT